MHAQAHLYADDTSILCSDKDIGALSLKLNRNMAKVSEWLYQNKLVLNIPKCQSILFGTHQRLSKCNVDDYNVPINGSSIRQVNEAKLLGVIFDSTLTFQAHIDKICKKISQKLGLLKYLRTILPQDYTKLLFNAIVKPHFEYCDIIWGNCSAGLFDKVYKLQKSAAQILTGASYLEHTKPLFQGLQWNTLYDNFKFHKCILTYKALHGKTPSYIRDRLVFTSDVSTRSTRSTSRSLLYVPKPKIDIFRNSFSYSGPFNWNKLPESVRLETSLEKFKRSYWKTKPWILLTFFFLCVYIANCIFIWSQTSRAGVRCDVLVTSARLCPPSLCWGSPYINPHLYWYVFYCIYFNVSYCMYFTVFVFIKGPWLR